ELRLGNLGNAAGRANAGRGEGVLRSHRGSQARRRVARRVVARNFPRSVRPFAARSGFQRSPTRAIRSRTLSRRKSSISAPAPISSQVSGGDTEARGRGLTGWVLARG